MKIRGAAILTLTLTLMAMGISAMAADGSWKRLEPMPVKRQSCEAVVIGNGLMVMGGEEPADGFMVIDTWQPDGGGWTTIARIRTDIAKRQAAVARSHVYVSGGMGTGDTVARRDFHRFDPSTGEWMECEPMLEPRVNHALVESGGFIYAMGGENPSTKAKTRVVERYDPSTGKWQRMADMPAYSVASAVAAVGGTVYVLGGVGQRRVLAYDTSTDSWRDQGEMPTNAFDSACAVSGSRILLFGGWNGFGSRQLRTVRAYDTSTGRWGTLPDMPGVQLMCAAVQLGDGTHILGGWRSEAGRFAVLADHLFLPGSE